MCLGMHMSRMEMDQLEKSGPTFSSFIDLCLAKTLIMV